MVKLHDDLPLTILGPTPVRLEQFIGTWVEEMGEALEKGRLTKVSPGLESMGSRYAPDLENEEDLETLAEKSNVADNSPANGGSIALLLEYKDRKVVLAGDAFPVDLVEAIGAVSGTERLRLDAFKLPHHCSRKNVLKPLIEAVDCGCWLISMDGTQFRHPDAIALAQVITFSKVRTPILLFNVPSEFNVWCDNAGWRGL